MLYCVYLYFWKRAGSQMHYTDLLETRVVWLQCMAGQDPQLTLALDLLLCLCRLVVPTDHPLDQLTPQEVSRASAVVRQHAAAQGISGTLRFNSE